MTRSDWPDARWVAATWNLRDWFGWLREKPSTPLHYKGRPGVGQ